MAYGAYNMGDRRTRDRDWQIHLRQYRPLSQHHKFFLCLYLLSIFSENWGQSQKDMIVLKQSDCGDHQAISDTKLTLTPDGLTEIMGVGDLLLLK